MVNWQERTSLSIFLFVLFIPIIIFVLFLMCRINFVPLAREDDQNNSLSNCFIRFYLFIFFFIYLFDLNDKFICICGSRYVQRPTLHSNLDEIGGGRVVRRCWVNFQCRGVLLIWITVGQGPTALAVGAGRDCLDIFTLIYPFSPLSPSRWETARYRQKYCLKGPLNPKQPTNQLTG